MRIVLGTLAALMSIAPAAVWAGPYNSPDGRYADGPVILSEREKRQSVPVRLPDGRVVLRPVNASGVPWLFGFGTQYGKASGLPTVGGSTPSVMKSTPSGGLIPGQDGR